MVTLSPNLLTGFVLVLLAVWVLLTRPDEPQNRTLAFLFLLFAGVTVSFGRLHETFPTTEPKPLFHALFWYDVPGIFLLALFIDQHFFDEPRPAWRKTALAGVGILVAAMLAVMATRDIHTQNPLAYHLGKVYGASYPLLWTAGVVLAARTVRDASGVFRRRQAALVGLAFLFILGQGTGEALSALASLEPTSDASRWAGLVAAPVVLWGLVWLPRAFEGPYRHGLAAVCAFPIVLGFLQTQGMHGIGPLSYLWGSLGLDPRSLVHAGFALLMSIAVVRYGLAGVAEDARAQLAQATGLTLGLLFVGAVAGIAWSQLGLGPLAIGSTLIALLALAGLAYTPLRSVPRRLASALVPDPASEEVVEERARIYRSALEEALGEEGQVKRESEPILANLRGELGLTERDHAVIRAGLSGSNERADVGNAVFGRYVLEERIGSGTSAAVYRATDSVIGRTVVVKRVRLAGETDGDLEEEMQVLGQLNHSRVVTLYTADSIGDEVFLVLEHCPGGSLADRLANGPLDPDEAGSVLADLAEGLAAIHREGLVHGDVKPDNVLFDEEGRAKLGDFGSARAIGRDPDVTVSAVVTEGTPSTMAPEQFGEGELSPATDVYALGALVYRILTGEHYLPFEGKTLPEIRQTVLHEQPRLAHERIPGELAPVLERALAKQPGDRQASVEELASQLAAHLPGPSEPHPLQAGSKGSEDA